MRYASSVQQFQDLAAGDGQQRRHLRWGEKGLCESADVVSRDAAVGAAIASSVAAAGRAVGRAISQLRVMRGSVSSNTICLGSSRAGAGEETEELDEEGARRWR